MNKTALAFGELLWDVLPTGAVIGGAPANFAFRLGSFGIPTRLVSRVGDDELGHKALEQLRALGVNTTLVQLDKKLPTGTVDVKLSESGNASYTINRDVAYDMIEPTSDLVKAARDATVICFGTLVQRADQSRKTLESLLSEAPNAIKFLDINLRKDCFSVETIQSSLKAATILKLNDDEVRVVNELLSLNTESIQDFSRKIIEQYSLDCCLITRAERGVFAMSKSGQEVDVPGRKVNVVDTIGSGDAFSAGFLTQYIKGATLDTACEFGNKIGGIVATTKGGMSNIPEAALENNL